MDFNDIQNLMKEMSHSDVNSLEIKLLESGDIFIKMQKNSSVQVEESPKSMKQPLYQQPQQFMYQQSEQANINAQPVQFQNPDVASVMTQKNSLPVEHLESPKDINCKEITSPIVGTFYESLSPDKPVFVKIGDKIKKGQTLCIIEAMKLMNEIESDYDGEIVEILVKNEQSVEYGQPLFRIHEN